MSVTQIGWRRQGLIRVPVVVPAAPKADSCELLRFTDSERREAHAAYVRGVRDPITVAGHREWDKLYRRTRRLRMTETDRLWAERDAIRSSWRQFERDNRKEAS